MKKLSFIERVLVVLIGGGISIGMYVIPLLIITKASNWLIAGMFIIAFRSWVKEVTQCK